MKRVLLRSGQARRVYGVDRGNARDPGPYLEDLKQRFLARWSAVLGKLETVANSAHAHRLLRAVKGKHTKCFEVREGPARLVDFFDSNGDFIVVLGFDKDGKREQQRLLKLAEELRARYLSEREAH